MASSSHAGAEGRDREALAVLGPLSSEERGILLGMVFAGESAERPLANLAEPSCTRCLEAHRSLARLEPTIRRRVVGELGRQLVTPTVSVGNPVPAEVLARWLATLHPSVTTAIATLLPREMRPPPTHDPPPSAALPLGMRLLFARHAFADLDALVAVPPGQRP